MELFKIGNINLIFCLLTGGVFGQANFIFDNISVQDGLSESTVKVIFEDHNGFIYFGTENGLDFYNGYEFLNYQMNAFDESSILGNNISCIFEDSNNMIWIGSELGVSKFNPNTRRFSRPVKLNEKDASVFINPETIAEDSYGNIWVKLSESHFIFQVNSSKDSTRCLNCEPSDLLNKTSIQTLYGDDNKKIWFGTDSGLFYFDNEKDKIVTFKANSDLFQSPITAIENGKNGELWIGTERGIGLIKAGSNNVRIYTEKTGLNSIISNKVNDLNWDNEKQELWIATKNGISIFNSEKNTFQNLQETPYANSIIENDVTKILLAEKSGNLWFTTENYSGFNCLTMSFNPLYGEIDTAFTHFEHDPIDSKSIADNDISTFIEDKAGNVWIGTRQNGISFHAFIKSKFLSIQNDPENEWGLKSDKIYSIATLSDGYLWVGTDQGLELLSPDGIREYEYEKSTLKINQIMDLEIINDEFLWVASTEGLLKIDLNTDEIKRFSSFKSVPEINRILENVIYDILLEENEVLWLGTESGLTIIDTKNDSTINYTSELVPRVMYKDNEGNIWLGTEINGLYFLPAELIPDVMAGNDFEIIGHIFDESITDGISSTRITCITQDLDGVIWVGTANGGLNRYHKEDDSFSHYFIQDGLPSNYITAIAVDKENHLWISSKNGISLFNQSSHSFTNFNLFDGIGNIDYFRNSFSISSNGNFFFGGPKGITVVNPSSIQFNNYQPPCVITRIKKTSFEDVVTEEFGESNKSIDINHKIKSFTIDFVALNYHKTEKNQYRYKLDPLDKDWIDAGDLRFASYNNLGRGSYKFKVQGSNDDGVWSATETLAIRFIPHPLLSYWAFGFYIVIGVFGIFGFTRQRMQQQIHALDEERRIQEMDQAREFQMSLIPQSSPDYQDYEFAFHMKTSTEVGGDYYDFFPQDDESLYVVVGDATGHGLNAGMMVSITKAGLVSTPMDSPASIVKNLNRAIKYIDLGTNRMSLNMTKIKNGTLEFTSAGMPPGYLYRHKDKTVEEILISGLPLGSMKEIDYDHRIFNFESGDAFVLLSDGLPECVNHDDIMLDYDAILQCTQKNGHLNAQGIMDSLIDLGDSWMNGLMNEDDITLVVIKRK